MKYMDITTGLEGVKGERARNFEDRIRYIKFWVARMKEVGDRKWSEEQARFIDGVHASARAAQLSERGKKRIFERLKEKK